MNKKLVCPYCNSQNLKLKRAIISKINKKKYELFLCTNCKIEFFTPLVFEDVYQTEITKGYSEFHKGRVETPIWTKNLIEILIKKKINLNEKNILEIGPGDGINFLALKKVFSKINSENYSIVELDKKSIEVCKKRGINKVYDFLFDSKNSNKIKEKFDVIIATEVFEHQTNPKEFMEVIFSKLKKDGIVIFTVPNKERFFLKQKESPEDIPPHHFLRFNKLFFRKNFKKIIYCGEYSYEFKNLIKSSKSISYAYFKSYKLWFFFLPISFLLRSLDKIRGEGLIVIFRKNE